MITLAFIVFNGKTFFFTFLHYLIIFANVLNYFILVFFLRVEREKNIIIKTGFSCNQKFSIEIGKRIGDWTMRCHTIIKFTQNA